MIRKWRRFGNADPIAHGVCHMLVSHNRYHQDTSGTSEPPNGNVVGSGWTNQAPRRNQGEASSKHYQPRLNIRIMTASWAASWATIMKTTIIIFRIISHIQSYPSINSINSTAFNHGTPPPRRHATGSPPRILWAPFSWASQAKDRGFYRAYSHEISWFIIGDNDQQ